MVCINGSRIMEIVLRPYQQELYDKVIEELPYNKKILVQAATGFGKSLLIAELANNLPGRVLVLTHRIEILNQNSEWINGVAILNAKRRKPPSKNVRCVISMSQTLHARIKKYGNTYMGDFDYVISDEVHVNLFEKVYSQYNYSNLIGLTATPITSRKETKEVVDEITGETVIYSRNMTMASEYDTLVTGVCEQDLVDLGFLSQDYNVVLEMPGMEKLVASTSNPDGYTTDSQNEVYANKAAMDIVYNAYLEYGKGKKTIIFNATTKVNLQVYEYFKEMGVNCMCFDSVNNVSGMNRKEIVNWYAEQDDGVLINCNVFTTGFSNKEVETIILNRKTDSLSLFLQCAGRGSRVTDKFFKTQFTCVDLGGNLAQHGRWSEKRDWHKLFEPNKWKKKTPSDLLNDWVCRECGAFNEPGTVLHDDGLIHCGYCGEVRIVKQTRSPRTGMLVPVDNPPMPDGRKIVDYTERSGKSRAFAFKLAEKKIFDLFIQYDITDSFYQKRQNGFENRIDEILKPIYNEINRSKLDGKRRRYDSILEKLLNRVNEMYGVKTIRKFKEYNYFKNNIYG